MCCLREDELVKGGHGEIFILQLFYDIFLEPLASFLAGLFSFLQDPAVASGEFHYVDAYGEIPQTVHGMTLADYANPLAWKEALRMAAIDFMATECDQGVPQQRGRNPRLPAYFSQDSQAHKTKIPLHDPLNPRERERQACEFYPLFEPFSFVCNPNDTGLCCNSAQFLGTNVYLTIWHCIPQRISLCQERCNYVICTNFMHFSGAYSLVYNPNEKGLCFNSAQLLGTNVYLTIWHCIPTRVLFSAKKTCIQKQRVH